MSLDDKAAEEITVSLSFKEIEWLKRGIADRKFLDCGLRTEDFVVEIVQEYIEKKKIRTAKKLSEKPNKTDSLFQYLFGLDAETTFMRISEGILMIQDNAFRLLDDASLLADAERYERTQFLITTAQEELGKAYILLDMCRVDIAKQAIQRRLSGYFYNHIVKDVYFDLSAFRYAGISELADLQQNFEMQTKEWWVGSPESGEPDMPHDMVFLREGNLYVDVDTHDQQWTMPSLEAEGPFYEKPLLKARLSRVQKALQRFRNTSEAGLFEPHVLRLFNKTMKKCNITEHMTTNDLSDLYSQIGSELEFEFKISTEKFGNSALYTWPIYWIN